MKSYTIKEFTELIEKESLLVESKLYGREMEYIENLTYNSKAACKNTLFICKGAKFKEEYVKEAVKAGSICYISEKKYDLEDQIPYIIVKDIRKAMPILADTFYNSPWEEFKLIGVGGTKGKTTSVYYIKAILDDYLKANQKNPSGIISSIDVYDGVVSKVSHITTPEAVELHSHFRNAADSNLDFLAMEISSQALKYDRVDRVNFDVGVFLNISEDHISPVEHPDFEDYFQSKLSMFKQTKTAVVNMDADFAERILEAAKAAQEIVTFSMHDKNADFYAYDIIKDKKGTSFKVKYQQFDREFQLAMPGLFNLENALAMIAVASKLNIPIEHIYSGIKNTHPKGRMEVYTSKDDTIVAIVDYAHNKLSFEKLFESVKEDYSDYEIVSVFGCPGQKALNRRKYLGRIAGENSNRIILTADEPAFEPVGDICNEIAQHIDPERTYEVIEDRTEAIKKAIKSAKGKTVIMIVGKGHETSQKIGNQYVDYPSDAVNALRFIEEYNAQVSYKSIVIKR